MQFGGRRLMGMRKRGAGCTGPEACCLVLLALFCIDQCKLVESAAATHAGQVQASAIQQQQQQQQQGAGPSSLRLRGVGALEAAQQELPPWRNLNLPVTDRVADLVSSLTQDEKLGLMNNYQQPVERLSIGGYQFWTECLHGHQERGSGAVPTIFPQPLLLASSFDDSLAWQVFNAISDELRAKDNAEYAKTGNRKGLVCWTPHVNIFKDPRWGRGSETFGEDPVLTGRMALRVVQGLQGSDPTYKKIVATCKHFLGYGMEGAEGYSRYSHNTNISPQDLTDTDLPPFKACVQGAGALGIMCAYNAVNGTASCASAPLLKKLLRSNMGFDGYVVSDCNAVQALEWGHKAYPSMRDASAAAVKAGVDLFCDKADELKPALAEGLLAPSDIDTAVNRTLAVRFATGQFDLPRLNPWADLPISTVNGRMSRLLARTVVQKGIVLLKNKAPAGSSKPLLPLDKSALSKLCVLGPLANSAEHMMGNYYGKFDADVAATPLQGIQEELAGSGVKVEYAQGMDIMGQIHYDWPLETALETCQGADAAVLVIGSSMIENDKSPDGSLRPAHEGEGLDRNNLDLPGRQADLVRALARRAPGLPLVVVLFNGGGLDVGWIDRLPAASAMLSAGFPGQEGGRGIADVLFGRVNPSGRLPITWYHSNYAYRVSQLDLRMRPDATSGYPGRSYRFVSDASYVLYPFGYGLSYSSFEYSQLRLLKNEEDGCVSVGAEPAFCLRVTVSNSGGAAGEHSVPLFLSHETARGKDGYPLQSLRAFKRTKLLEPGSSEDLEMLLSQSDFVMPRPSDGVDALHLGPWEFTVGSFKGAAGSGGQVGSMPAASITAEVTLPY
ncbi:glycoside hydrolase superfamily [Scenedesmus sp. NREL 46B-D3]|nr:glycoside hydrolase superfamily [Scenedesmus sp. NREL 46B-D3]